MFSVYSARLAMAVAFALCTAGTVFAQPSQLGRPARQPASTLATTDIGRINPSFTFTNASFGTGAVGLRNRGEGGIAISGVTAPIKRAFAYWAVVTDGPPTVAASNIYMKRGVANGPFTNIAGVPIGTGASPCWRGDRTTVFRATLPLSLANGNGLYLILLRPGANGSTKGENPWVASVPPLFEGVSIVLIGTGTSTVSVYDSRLAGKMFFNNFAYQLTAPVSVTNATEILFHDIGADGQGGVGVEDIAATAGEITALNGRRIAGPGSPAGAGNWNGNAATPLPQLWDNNTHDVTGPAHAGSSPTVMPFVITAPDDCVVTVANILSID